MRTSLLLIFSVLLSLESLAQSKYCCSYSDFKSGRWIDLPDVKVDARTKNSRFWSGGGDFKIESADKTVNKILKKKARFVSVNDTLYVNCKGLSSDAGRLEGHYAMALRYDGDKVIFWGDREEERTLLMSALWGDKNTRMCYLIDSDSKHVARIDRAFMEVLLAPRPDLEAKYAKVSTLEKESETVILEYLHALGLVQPD